jgi:crotonobetainyl-CoA:carnitine CoA-transferase CaiB-like acyl-CoA transferase
VPYQSFVTADGYLMLAVGNDRQFQKFCEIAGCADLPGDARFATNAARVAHRAALVPLLEAIIRKRTTRGWLESLAGSGVPCGPINDIEQVFDEPQVRHRAMRIDLPHPTAGTAPGIRNPALFSRTRLEYRASPPLLGQHTDAVLTAHLGLGREDLVRLRSAGIIR